VRFSLVGIFKNGPVNEAGVSPNGELLIRSFDYSEPTIKQLTDTTVTEFAEPRDGQQFVLTGMYASADRSIGANGELLEIYESLAGDSGTQDKLLFSVDLARQGNANPVFPPGLISPERFVNADRTNTSGTITVSIWGFYVPRIA